MREDGQRLGEIDVLDDHIGRHGELHGGEVPDAADTGCNKLIGAGLGGRIGNR